MRVRSLSDLYHQSKAQLTALQDQIEREERKAKNERLVLELLMQLRTVNLAELFTREQRFHEERMWRLDLYCEAHRLGVEIHGGVWTGGRHITGRGFSADRVKMCAAVEAGIRVLEYTADQIKSGAALAQIERIITRS